MSVAMGDTFLTQPDLPEPEGMTRVREEHSRLQGVVFSLNKRISQVLAKQEGDFLAAYRAHMYTVQKELQTLRQRVIEAENVLQVWSTVRSQRRSWTFLFIAANGRQQATAVPGWYIPRAANCRPDRAQTVGRDTVRCSSKYCIV